MRNSIVALGLLAAGLLFWQSCSESTIVGSDLLEDDQIDIGFTDTLSLKAYTRRGDSIRTYAPELASQLTGYLIGQINDPVFGVLSSTVSAQLRLATFGPDFDGVTLDSIVFILPYYPARVYGDTSELHGIDVYTLDEALDSDQTYFSDQSYVAGEKIGSVQFYPAPNDSLDVGVYGGEEGETVRVAPHVRIALDQEYGNWLIGQDPATFDSDSAFLEVVNGLQFVPTTVNRGLISYNLRTGGAGLRFYYRRDTSFFSYFVQVGEPAARVSTFRYDYGNAVAGDFLDNPELGDSLLFVQGTAGLTTVFEIPNAASLSDKIINRAELELTIISLPEESGYRLPPVQQLIVSEIVDDTTRQVIDDVIFALESGDLDGIFGGTVEDPDDGSPSKYRLNLSAYLKDVKNGVATNKFQITVLTQAEIASRVILCGPGHPDYPAKLKVSYTNF
ncbi:MAG: DUF4270 family protein [Saprospiraceae bacterium]|nr:DUF4270 family protein [Saprospiraceae bacterium]MCB0623502.1 DUF4270 family protein [Saprospiraceae bacterium]MCB0675340.1 DUF4270 family protein [Saprospiraceae bacterium]MCB0679916.1 DUF4270 family protein [Saprospiraceae bacterium]